MDMKGQAYSLKMISLLKYDVNRPVDNNLLNV